MFSGNGLGTRAVRTKKSLGVGLVAVLALGLTACELEKGPNDTRDQAVESNSWAYDGGTFEGGGALRQPQYESAGVSSADDWQDVFVLRAANYSLPKGDYRLHLTFNTDSGTTNPGGGGIVTVIDYRGTDGRWTFGRQQVTFCYANSPCTNTLDFSVPSGVTALSIETFTANQGLFPVWGGTYAFKVARV